jgi:hypothetical protein
MTDFALKKAHRPGLPFHAMTMHVKVLLSKPPFFPLSWGMIQDGD